MANNNLELIFILDASGSMHGLEQDTIGGVNRILEEQKKIQNGGTVYVTSVTFNNKTRTLHDRLRLEEIQPLTEKEYCTQGCTALYDAIGETVEKISNIHKYIRAEDVPDKTLCVIMTDGMENASRRYYREEVLKGIEERKAKGWEFLFLAANVEAAEYAESLGIEQERAIDFCADKEGLDIVCDCVENVMHEMRLGGAYSREAFKKADALYQKRKGNKK